MFAISAIREQLNKDGEVIKQDAWDTFRRYSDFAYLHDSLKENVRELLILDVWEIL